MRWAVVAFEVALFVYWAIVLWTQIVAPLIAGTKLFPYFRDDLTTEGVKLRTDLERQAEEDFIAELRKKLQAHDAPAPSEGEKE